MESLRSFRLKIVRESRKFILPKPDTFINVMLWVISQIKLGLNISIFDFLLVIISIVTLPVWFLVVYSYESYHHIKTKYYNYRFAKKFGVFGMYGENIRRMELDKEL